MTDLDAATLAAIIESSGDAIVTKTLDGIVTSWNPAAEQIFGYPAREMVGRSITTIFPPDRVAEETEFQRRMLAGQPRRWAARCSRSCRSSTSERAARPRTR